MRAHRELEPPTDDEGFASVERVAFARTPTDERAVGGVFVAAAAVGRSGWDGKVAGALPESPHLVLDWKPDGTPADLDAAVEAVAAIVEGPVEAAICPHPGGAPICWCRPPLPGLTLAFARRHGLDPARSLVVGTTPAHRTLATTLGARYVAV